MYKYKCVYTRTSEPNHFCMCTMRITICISAYHFATSPHKIDVPHITQSNFSCCLLFNSRGKWFMKLCTFQIIPKLRIHAKK